MGAGLGGWIKADQGIVFAFWRGTRKQAKIFSIQFLIFLDSGLWENIRARGAKVLLVVLIWVKENRFEGEMSLFNLTRALPSPCWSLMRERPYRITKLGDKLRISFHLGILLGLAKLNLTFNRIMYFTSQVEGPISYLFQTCHKLNKTLLRLFTLKPAIKLSNTGKCLKWETVHQRQRRESEKCLYIQKNLRSSIIRLGCNSSRGWRRAKANTNDQSTPIERRQRESPQPPNSLQD